MKYRAAMPLRRIFLSASAFLYAPAVLAQEIKNPLGPGTDSFIGIINRIADFAVLLITPIAVLVILYAAALFMFSAGDIEKVKKAKRALLWAVVGLMIVLTGKGLISIIEDALKGGGSAFCERNPADPQCYGP